MDGIQFEANQHSCPLLPVSLPVLSVCLPFRRSPTVFRFFSRVHYLCQARGNIVPTAGPASRIFLLFYDPYKREYQSTITSCSRGHSYVTMAVARMSEEPFSSPKNITRDYAKLHKLQSGYYLCSEMGVIGIMLRPNIMITHATIDCYLYVA